MSRTTRPILFSAPMVSALLDGRKTQTRRATKGHWVIPGLGNRDPSGCPYGSVGGLLWVRETWAPAIAVRAFYRATHEKMLRDDGWTGPWKPAIHMPRSASRITLRLTEVRVERLTDISDQDAAAEGIAYDMRRDPLGPCKWASVTDVNRGWSSPVAAYQELWESINGKGSWALNPWVWALTFSVEKRNVDDVLRAVA